MEKTVKIDGKDVRLKSSAALPLKYKAQFGRDFFKDIDSENRDTEVLFNVIWVLAKAADNSIPDVIEWIDSFEAFPVFRVFGEANELVILSMGTTEKNAQTVAEE